MIYLPNPLIGVRGLHEEIVAAFGQPAAHLGSRLTVQAGKALAAEREERGRTPVLILDEAHLLTYEQLETIRMLTSQSMDQDSPLQLPDLNVVDEPLGFDFEFFSASGAQVGTPANGISPDQGGQINTIQPGQGEVFTFSGVGTSVDQSGDTVHVASCTALIAGYSNAY